MLCAADNDDAVCSPFTLFTTKILLACWVPPSDKTHTTQIVLIIHAVAARNVASPDILMVSIGIYITQNSSLLNILLILDRLQSI